MTASGWTLASMSASSSHSAAGPMRPNNVYRGWVSACTSAVRSSKRTVGASGRNRLAQAGVPLSPSSCQNAKIDGCMSPRAFNFGAGNPDPGVFPAQELGEAAQRVVAHLGKELAHYPDPLGLPELRAVAVQRFERNHGLRPPLEHVVIKIGR